MNVLTRLRRLRGDERRDESADALSSQRTRPDDIGAAIALLLAPGSQWINGQRVEASGGMFL
jgi:NAD(P)-dependent dehydrogenase (short-subunit alcohol dehydrogenase family)